MTTNLPILAVDDDPASLDVLKIMLEHEAQSVSAASDAETALEMLLSNTYALVIVDLRLPNMDGWRLLQTIRAHAELQDVRAVALTAYYEPSVAKQARQAGFVSCLPKPITNETVARILALLRN